MAETAILGIGELRESFAKLKSGMETRIARAMVVSAGGVLKKRAKANMRAQGLVLTGSMVKNVVIKRETGTPKGIAQYHLGVRHGRAKSKAQKATGRLAVNTTGRIVKRYADDPYYWKFHEFGTKRKPKSPSLGPALEQGREEAIAAMATRLQKELDKAGKV